MVLLPVIRRDGQIIDPTAVTLVAAHDGRYQLPIDRAEQQQFAIYFYLALDILARVIPGHAQAALLPQ